MRPNVGNLCRLLVPLRVELVDLARLPQAGFLFEKVKQ